MNIVLSRILLCMILQVKLIFYEGQHSVSKRCINPWQTFIHLKILMHEIFFLSDILFASYYFTCTCLVLQISLFRSIAVNIVVKSFPYLAFRSIYGQAPPITRVYVRCHGRQETIFEYMKSIVKVEIGIATLVSYHHYLKIVGNNKL